MRVFELSSISESLSTVIPVLLEEGTRSDSRNGEVIAFNEPVSTIFLTPLRSVYLCPWRKANHFFHFLEAFWMLAGRNDVAFPAHYVKTMVNYSDDGKTFNGAYGYRWRVHFGIDQILSVIEGLKKNPTCRRQVISMWDGSVDLNPISPSKDLPCNLQAKFSINKKHPDRLDMVVFNRSNDIIWGAYGANIVHFSYLQDFIAASLGLEVGRYTQVSADFHAYTGVLEKFKGCWEDTEMGVLDVKRSRVELKTTPEIYLRELGNLLDNCTGFQKGEKTEEFMLQLGFFNHQLRQVKFAVLAHAAMKRKDFSLARKYVLGGFSGGCGWMEAFNQQITRAEHRFNKATDDGVFY